MWTARIHPKPLWLALALILLCAAGQALELDGQYRQILTAWSEGSVDSVEALGRFHQGVADAHAGREVDDSIFAGRQVGDNRRFLAPGDPCLERIESLNLDPLFALEPEATLPAFVLYLQAYAIYVQRPGNLWLAARMRRQLGRILNTHKKRSRVTQAAKRRGIRDLTLMLLAQADEMRAQGRVIEDIRIAADFFERALLKEPGNLAAAYWAAVMHERLAHTQGALRHLRALAKRRPKDFEIHLRLAINQVKNGKARAAEKTFRRLSTSQVAPPWVRMLAYEELARLEGEIGALQTLSEGHRAFPDDAQLSLQLTAHLGDDWTRIDRLAAAILPSDDDPIQPSPRLLYDQPRRDELDLERMALMARTRELLPTLGAALEALGREGAAKHRDSVCKISSLPTP